ncbi:MAG: hypothetical protein DIU61_012485 [Bacteroidota bacterium]|nr:MAG: hypothetical protein DIU61_07440 [Bacteroidota bacterium]
MKKELKYLLLLGVAALIYLLFKLFAPRDYDWTVTFNIHDKNPFGGYVLNELINDVFPENRILHSYRTIYELYDTIDAPVNFLSLSSYLHMAKEDTEALLANVYEGGNAFISTEWIYGPLADTLSIEFSDYYWDGNFSFNINKEDTAALVFTNPALHSPSEFRFPRNTIRHYVQEFDTLKSRVIATNDLGLPVTVSIPWGKGRVIINSTPMAFTNAYILLGENPDFTALSLSLLPKADLIWTEYYHLGRAEVETPLRFILTTEPLRWAYYLTIGAILLFMFFEAKRKQRIIPVIKPLTNTSVEFVTTIGNLYFQNGDHKDIAEKRIAYFLERIRTKYWLNTQRLDEEFMMSLARRSGTAPEIAYEIFSQVRHVQSRSTISAEELRALNQALEKFEIQTGTNHKP